MPLFAEHKYAAFSVELDYGAHLLNSHMHAGLGDD